MRLIDRQAAVEVADAVWTVTGDKNVAKVWQQLKDLPTVDAVPVVHGRWIDKDGSIATCSVCGDRWGVWSVMTYCPNCGAKMDERGNDSETD